MVGNVAHGIQRLARRAGGDEGVESREAFGGRRERGFDLAHDGENFGQAARSELAARHRADIRLDDAHTVGAQAGDIALSRRVFPHPHVHRRHHQHWLVGGEQRCGREVVRNPSSRLGHQVRSGGANDDKIGRPRQLDMAHLGLVGEIEQLRIDLLAREGGDRQGRDKLGAGLGQDRTRGNGAPAELADQLKALIGGNTAADDQEDSRAFHQVCQSGLSPFLAQIP